MRLLIWCCLALVLFNVVVYLWPDKANYAPHVQTEKPEINPNYVRLNKEIEDDFYKRKAADNAVVAQPDVNVAREKLSSCYRVGPFVHEENFKLAQAVLFDETIAYKKARRESKESNVFRVFLGPFDSQAEAIDMRSELRRKQILDHFIRKNTEGEYIVSLGIYSSQASVDDAVELFSRVLEGVKFDGELVLLPDSYWLYFSLDDENLVRKKLLQLDWGERAAKMGKFECQT